jgi:glycosyltransferase involved in cell wall biosynthesis
LKICYIISDIDKAVYFEQTALALREQGCDLSFILVNCTNKTLHQFLEQHGFKVFTLEAGSLLRSRKTIMASKRILKENLIDLVHCHLAQANWVGLWAAKLAGIKMRLYTRHSGEPLKLHWKERIIDKIQNRLATHIIAISGVIEKLLEKQRVPAQKRILIHHGFNLKRFSEFQKKEVGRIKETYNPSEQQPVIGVIARWMNWKGIQYTIAAFQQLLKTHPDALLCLFGASDNADYSQEISRLVQKLPEQNVCVVPFENNVFDLYQLFDIYVHVPVNPDCEAFGQTYVEALAAGIPSVFTLSGIAREFITGKENALVVPFKNAEAIHQAILQLLNDPVLQEKLKRNGPESVRELFNFERYIAQLKMLYSR